MKKKRFSNSEVAGSMPMQAERDRWQAEDDHRTLQRAAEVTSDPSRMKRVAAHHAKVGKMLHESVESPSKEAAEEKNLKRKMPSRKMGRRSR